MPSSNTNNPSSNSVGLPPLSASAQAQLEQVAKKLPKSNKNPPIWDLSQPHLLVHWLEALDSIFDGAVVTEEQLKIKFALDWVTFPMKDILISFSSITMPNWKNFKRDLKTLFPDTIDDECESMYKLEEIIDWITLIMLHMREKLHLYDIMFEREVSKLQTELSVIMNRDAVHMYIMLFAEEVQQLIW
ncbi:hypothetical protein GYMLUDRAFT_178849 [Collybiopsis luxurians FD-317 M1]|uniref:Unplaced genomic scaffold GYMLUscaffold_80, whole genome shotgun sequence n=1 Tax=Collybiopsis luxurians FD-317 M1 TaxID=944289 RepID=A0A0D0BV97_9AGAR|nr:hypothetical protein GYMLUDRAFT_178849 [Collybiopsis luxurians FD-317 M1]